MSTAITLGTKVRDILTGFTGFATARAEYLYGQSTIQIEATAEADGTTHSEWVNEGRVEVVTE